MRKSVLSWKGTHTDEPSLPALQRLAMELNAVSLLANDSQEVTVSLRSLEQKNPEGGGLQCVVRNASLFYINTLMVVL